MSTTISASMDPVPLDQAGKGDIRTGYVPEMLALRQAGWSYTALGRFYGKDHSTILHHCKKFGIRPLPGAVPQYPDTLIMGYRAKKKVREALLVAVVPVIVPPPAPEKPSLGDIYLAMDGRVNEGHPYSWYLKQNAKRPKGKLRPWIKNYMKKPTVPVARFVDDE